MARRSVCPVCGQGVAVTKDGRVMKHGRSRHNQGTLVGDTCSGSGAQVLPPKNEPSSLSR
jgi:hypothetical protein